MSEPTVLYANNSESIRQQQQQHHQQATTSADFSEEAPSAEVDIDVQVRNVVCNYSLPLHIDLRRIALNTGNVTLDKSKGV
jgi:TATA-box binding protein (TBP) (component of TFIID and TFIIIB)